MPESGGPTNSTAARHLELVIEYSGARFAGWQVQPNNRTGQGEIERAIAEITREDVRIVAASRTDAGVHALGQVASFSTRSALAPHKLRRGLNALLPDDIAVRRVREVDPEFHARFGARGKHYRYRILAQFAPSPSEAGRTWHLPYPLDVEAMARAAAHLEGRHDFKALVSRPDGDGDCTRTLHAVRVSWEPQPFAGVAPNRVLAVDVFGDGFLYKMVRTIAGTLADVGRGKLAADSIPGVLRSGARRKAGPTAPPEGLFLVRVFYSDEALRASLSGEAEEVEREDHDYRPRDAGPGGDARVRRSEGEEARALP